MGTHLKARSATVTLYQGDDMDRLAQLRRAAEIAANIAQANEGTARMGDDDSSVADAQRAFDAFVDEAAERALQVRLESIGREFFRDLIAQHPPRMVPKKVAPPAEGESAGEPEMVEHDEDAGYGVNTETFGKALLTFRRTVEDGDEPELVATIALPEFKTEAAVRRFVDRELSEGDFDQLWIAAYFLNRSPSSDPKVAGFGTSPTGSLSTDET